MVKTLLKSLIPVSAGVLLVACGGGTSKLEDMLNQANTDVKACSGNGQELMNCVQGVMTQLGQDWAQLAPELQGMSESDATRITGMYQELVNTTTELVMEASTNMSAPEEEIEPEMDDADVDVDVETDESMTDDVEPEAEVEIQE